MNLHLFYDYISQKTGMRINEQRAEVLQRWLNDFDLDPNEVYNDLNNSPLTSSTWQNIINLISIGETYFFRNKAHFSALRYRILPELIKERREAGHLYLRLWSAGCATGEEPYSLAMLLHELLPDIDDWSLSILGTDITTHALQQAKHGVYSAQRFRQETPEDIKVRWFKKQDNDYHLNPIIKQMVTFVPLNLVSDQYTSVHNGTVALDLIVCRNVTIYFDSETTAQVVQGFYDSLQPGGWLIVGHSEPQSTTYDMFEMISDHKTILYRRSAKRFVQPESPILYNPPEITVAAAPPREPNIDVWLREAQDAANHEDWQMAHSYLNTANEFDAFNPYVHYLRGLIETELNDYDAAVRSFRRALYCDSRCALAQYSLGNVYLRMGRPLDTRRVWESAMRQLSALSPDVKLPFSHDLTVGMLHSLLQEQIEETIMSWFDKFSLHDRDVLRKRAREIANREDDIQVDEFSMLQFRLNDASYSVRLEDLTLVYRNAFITPIPGVPQFVKGLANLRGYLMPVFDLGTLVGTTPMMIDQQVDLIVTEYQQDQLGFCVGSIDDILHISESQIETVSTQIDPDISKYVAGILTNGSILIDLAAICADPALIVDNG